MSIVFSTNKDGVLHVAVCGKITRDPEVKQNAKGDKVKFSICYAKSQYMDCDAWADSDAGHMAMCLEKGDTVLAMGIHRKWTYNDKAYQSVSVDGVFPMSIPSVSASEPPAASETKEALPANAGDGWDRLDDDDSQLPF